MLFIMYHVNVSREADWTRLTVRAGLCTNHSSDAAVLFGARNRI
jgi:hypothetical protein